MISITKTRWEILCSLSKADKTPSELAKELKKSIPAVYEQLSYLERLKMIKKTAQAKGKTRPYTRYSIGKGFVHFIKVLPKEAEERFLEVDENLRLHLRVWSIPQKELHCAIERFWWDAQTYINDIKAIAVYGSVAQGSARKGSDIDILIIAKKNVAKLENKFGAKMYDKKMVMAQVFTQQEFKEAGKFTKEVLKNMLVIYDPNNILESMKEALKLK